MVQIKRGDTFTATGVRTGDGKNGQWWMCKINAEKGSDSITLWCPGCTANEGDTVTVANILSVKKSARKYQEKWYDTYEAEVEFAAADFAELEDEDGDTLPF